MSKYNFNRSLERNRGYGYGKTKHLQNSLNDDNRYGLNLDFQQVLALQELLFEANEQLKAGQVESVGDVKYLNLAMAASAPKGAYLVSLHGIVMSVDPKDGLANTALPSYGWFGDVRYREMVKGKVPSWESVASDFEAKGLNKSSQGLRVK